MIMHRSLVVFAMVAVLALFAVSSMPASQQASAKHKAHTASSQVSTTTVAVHHKAHTASSQVSTTTVAVHHKAHIASKGKISVHQVAVDPQTHGIPLLNATALKKEIAKEVKGPYGESDVIGGMESDGY
jgi:maltose-binding protein MalE